MLYKRQEMPSRKCPILSWPFRYIPYPFWTCFVPKICEQSESYQAVIPVLGTLGTKPPPPPSPLPLAYSLTL